jgi:hypothetical protein
MVVLGRRWILHGQASRSGAAGQQKKTVTLLAGNNTSREKAA